MLQRFIIDFVAPTSKRTEANKFAQKSADPLVRREAEERFWSKYRGGENKRNFYHVVSIIGRPMKKADNPRLSSVAVQPPCFIYEKNQ